MMEHIVAHHGVVRAYLLWAASESATRSLFDNVPTAPLHLGESTVPSKELKAQTPGKGATAQVSNIAGPSWPWLRNFDLTLTGF